MRILKVVRIPPWVRVQELRNFLYIRQNLTKTWRMRTQLLLGVIFAGSDIKAKIRPGIEASVTLN